MEKIVKKVDDQLFTTREYCLIGILLLIAGILIGMIFSPKGDRAYGSNNGNNNGNNNRNDLSENNNDSVDMTSDEDIDENL